MKDYIGLSVFSPRNSPILPIVEYNQVHQLRTQSCFPQIKRLMVDVELNYHCFFSKILKKLVTYMATVGGGRVKKL